MLRFQFADNIFSWQHQFSDNIFHSSSHIGPCFVGRHKFLPSCLLALLLWISLLACMALTRLATLVDITFNSTDIAHCFPYALKMSLFWYYGFIASFTSCTFFFFNLQQFSFCQFNSSSRRLDVTWWQSIARTWSLHWRTKYFPAAAALAGEESFFHDSHLSYLVSLTVGIQDIWWRNSFKIVNMSFPFLCRKGSISFIVKTKTLNTASRSQAVSPVASLGSLVWWPLLLYSQGNISFCLLLGDFCLISLSWELTLGSCQDCFVEQPVTLSSGPMAGLRIDVLNSSHTHPALYDGKT